MPLVSIVRKTDVQRTARVVQLEGIFDLPPTKRSELKWDVKFDLPAEWNVGAIVGPSGAGKTTIAKELFGSEMVGAWEWPAKKSVIDGFPEAMALKDIVGLLSSVGFSSPPSWLRPYHVLSNGEQFRVNMARTIAEMPAMAVVDEFTSVVDRTVAKCGSAAIAKTVRSRKQKFVAVSCHYDILEWLCPDWVYEPASNEFYTGRYLRRPSIELTIAKVHPHAWQLFHHHHYLDTKLHTAAKCFVAFWGSTPVGFYAVIHQPHPRTDKIKRGHRMVCLPDYQGVGIGNKFIDTIGAMIKGCGFKFVSTTSHPAMMGIHARSPHWNMVRKPALTVANGRTSTLGSNTKGFGLHHGTRLSASFEYVGPTMDSKIAREIYYAEDPPKVKL